MIDEAPNFDVMDLKEFRILSDINADGVQLLQVILVGHVNRIPLANVFLHVTPWATNAQIVEHAFEKMTINPR